jgi:hypothetical protein
VCLSLVYGEGEAYATLRLKKEERGHWDGETSLVHSSPKLFNPFGDRVTVVLLQLRSYPPEVQHYFARSWKCKASVISPLPVQYA